MRLLALVLVLALAGCTKDAPASPTIPVPGDQANSPGVHATGSPTRDARPPPSPDPPMFIDCGPKVHENWRTQDTFVIHPRQPATMWVGVEWDGVFRSDDAGATWRHVDAGLPSAFDRANATRKCFLEPGRIVLDPDDLDRALILFVSGAGTLDEPHARFQGGFQTRDGGATWTRLHRGSMNTDGGRALALDPVDARVIYMGTGNTTVSANYPGASRDRTYVTNGVLYRSADAGATWEELPTGLAPGLKATSVFVDPADPAHLILFTYARLGVDPGAKSVGDAQLGPLASRDGGRTWASLAATLPAEWRAIARGWASADLRHMYIEAQNATFASRGFVTLDGGATWQPARGFSVVAYDPHDPRGLHALAISGGGGTTTGPPDLYETKDGGLNWTKIAAFPPDQRQDRLWHLTKLVWHPAAPGTIFVSGHGGYVARSDDLGQTWTTLLRLHE